MKEWMLDGKQLAEVHIKWEKDKAKIGLYEYICQAQARKIVEWGEDPCKEHWNKNTGRRPLRRFDCPECMEQLKRDLVASSRDILETRYFFHLPPSNCQYF